MDMKRLTKLVIGIIALALVIAAVVFVVRLVGGLITGAFNLVLGIVVVVALVAIVAWMFWYAAKNK